VHFFQAQRERQDFADRLFKRADRRDLRADVHLQPPQAQVFQPGRPRVNGLDCVEGDADESGMLQANPRAAPGRTGIKSSTSQCNGRSHFKVRQ
jgi:hypothetical protein